jgi:hypothetical protein
MRKFEKIGGRTGDGRRNPWFQIIKHHGRFVVDRKKRFYHAPIDALVRVADVIPRKAFPAVPSWVKEITYHPTA